MRIKSRERESRLQENRNAVSNFFFLLNLAHISIDLFRRKRGRDESSEREQRHVHVSIVALVVAGRGRLRRDYVLFNPRRGRRSRREQRNCIVVVATLPPRRCYRLQRLRMRPREVYTAWSYRRDHSPRPR